MAVENELICALDDLEATGILQSANRMDIKALLNPPEESQIDGTTDEEICQAVLAACNSLEEGPMDDDVEGGVVIEPPPTYCDMFQAVSIINRYVDHIDAPVARKLEAVMASFGCQMRLERSQTLTPTHITDYFHHI